MSGHPYDRVYNFSAGPAIMPVPVLEQVRDELLNFHQTGMSVMEMSHRGKVYSKIAEEVESRARQLMGIPDNYKILFLQGGASMQFTVLAKNFLHGGVADYVVTGTWGKKAIDAAKFEGDARAIYDAKATNYDRCPEWTELNHSSDASYCHFTMNETIQGVDFLSDPADDGHTYICDMSSCIASRPIDISRYGVIYAGAQKNLGPAGVALVIVREDLLEKVPGNLPPMLDLKNQVENGWMYNTPPTFGVYICSLVFQHWIDFGGLQKVAQHNEQKAKFLYDAIDQSGGFYKGHAVEKNRSLMNVAFTLAKDELTDQFLGDAKAAGFHELKGHRSVGGCRASIYNAFPIEGCRDLAAFMGEFAKKNG